MNSHERIHMQMMIRREAETARLSEMLLRPAQRVNICSVYGTGGVGKTTLVDDVIGLADIPSLGYLKIAADGYTRPQLRADFMGLVAEQLAPDRLCAPARTGKDYFYRVRSAASKVDQLIAEVEALATSGATSENFKKVVHAMLRAGQVLNHGMPRSRDYFDFSAISEETADELIDQALSAIRQAKSNKKVRRYLAFSDHLYDRLAEAYIADLCSLIGRRRPFSKLLMVIDDYERIGETLGEFIFGHVVLRLTACDFTSVILVVGRDSFQSSDPYSYQRARQFVSDQIRLPAFTKEQALEFLGFAGISGQEAERAYQWAEGLPFLLSLIADEKGLAPQGDEEGDPSDYGADFPRQFYDRTTKWLTRKERNWFDTIVYLDTVNTDTLEWFCPVDQVAAIQYWFEREASLRDPVAKVFRVRRIVREKVIQYLSKRSPSRHRQMLETIRVKMQGDARAAGA